METKALYDQVAREYDNLYQDDVCRKEYEAIKRAITSILRGSVLDIGCGTGFLPAKVDLTGHEYLGVDISDGMIEIAKEKFPLQSFLAMDFMDLKEKDKYNTVISTFCAGSYIGAERFINKIEKIITDDGLFFVMLYGCDSGYPEYYTEEMKQEVEVLDPSDAIERLVDGRGYYLSVMDENGDIYQRARKGCSGRNIDKKIKYYIVTNYDMFMPTSLVSFIKGTKRTFAKTYADKAPHEYIVRNKVDQQMFVDLAQYIRSNGYRLTFRGRTYTYMNFGKRQYWTMGNPIDETTVLNRAFITRE